MRSLAKTCNFGELRDNLIRDRIVIGIRDNSIRKKLLAEGKLTLDKCINICRANETTAKQLKEIRQSEDVNAITHRHPQRKAVSYSKGQSPEKGQRSTLAQPTMIKCKFCCKTHLSKKESCPTWQKTCKECGQLNHFSGSAACKGDKQHQKQKPVHGIEDLSDDNDDEYFRFVESVGAVSDKNYERKISAIMHLRDQRLKFQLDCGATVNILPVDRYRKVFNDPQLARLNKTTTKLQMFNKTELTPLGSVNVETLDPKNEEILMLEYLVVAKGHMPILGAQAIQEFKLMTINSDNIMSVMTAAPAPAQPHNNDIVAEFKGVFEGDGKLEGQLHFEVDTSVSPVALPVRKTPIALKEPLKRELDRLTDKGILQPVHAPTDWVSSMVVATKRNGKIRLCVDPKPLNKALKRSYYPLPLIDDLLPKLMNARVFTVVDAKNGFWHVQLDEPSSLLTTFGTPWGRYRWTRMPFGISVAPEEFQRRLNNALEGLNGVEPILDDILLYGVGETYAEALSDHDTKLRALFQRCRDKGIKLNKEKLKLRCSEVSFMGHTVSKVGLKPDPAKLQGIQEMPSPQNKQDIKRFLGMINYLQRYAPNLSQATAPLRDLLKETNQFCWDTPQKQSFNNAKQVYTLEFGQRPKALATYAAETPEIRPDCYVQEGFRDGFSRYTKPCLWQFH